ncbi:adenosylcobinamide-phosphate synthase CbiB [Variovorax ginsengisoli]|uniref:Cobalamin biosynthesis protein CobD n=1 Tax=Variovorax ginsengisoli TaxID=363844 RepID=A0ABT9SDT5_9BURK|nr:adenosylcobinamide-phosphate synthase CbiB [Variovorax ginsengisoli]MDP9902526.1 adenosylcobinamide-phosphate synthase [Variovorax ginsengisoli]
MRDAAMLAGLSTWAALCIALLVDHCWGEPPARWHPVVWMGRYLGWAGARVAPPMGRPYRRARAFVAGMLAWCVGAGCVLAVALGVQGLLVQLPWWLSAPLLGLCLKPLLAWRMLHAEVLAVETALGVSLAAGRAQLARLVSRDVAVLSEAEVRESAIESLAENLNDSVVAPLFWFVLLGLPGAALYRFANTADAMWGYLGERGGRDWTWAGKWTARVDDVLSWLPARMTAAVLWMTAPRGRVARQGWRRLRREAQRTPSPNSGWPMAAMALRLDVRLGKPGVYTLHAAGRSPVATDSGAAARLGHRVVATVALGALPMLLAWRHLAG